MITESRKLFFKKAFIFSDDELFMKLCRSGEYSSVVALSYKNLPKDFGVQYTKDILKIRIKSLTGIDLKLSEDEIFNKFNDTTKKHIKRTFKNDDLVFDQKKNPDGESYKVYKNFEYYQGRVPIVFEEFTRYRLFRALYKNQEISGVSLLESKPNVKTITIYSRRVNTEDKETYKIIAYATRRIMWEICLWAKKEDFTFFDLGSINLDDPKKAGVTEFKLSFGGEIIPEYTYIYKSNAFIFFEQFIGIKVLLKKLLFILKLS